MSSTQGVDDYALERVPAGARYSWWSVCVQRFGQLSCLSQFLIGATLGFGMSFWSAVLAITLGSVILEVVAIFTGIAGQREGLSTSVLTRWTGFGRYGSSLVGLAIALSLIGWFGVQSAISARGLTELIGVLPTWGWALVFGMAVTGIVMYGFGSMAWTAYITVPAFLLLAGYAVISELSKHSLSDLVSSPAPGPQISLAAGTTLVAGGFIVGMVMTPDMTRFNRSTSDVVKQTFVGVTIGEYVIALVGVLLAHAVGTSDIIGIVTSSAGLLGTLIIVASTVKINDWNLYSASLGVVNFGKTVFGVKLHRGLVTLTVGGIGSVLAAAGILEKFTDFLIVLGVAFPPLAGIIIAEYFFVKLWRSDLDESGDDLPAGCPTWVPTTLVVWGLSWAVGYYVDFGIASINALVASFVLYLVAGKLGLVRPLGISRTGTAQPADDQHA
ncbi:purine-cytosine permease family protein [Actinokineospora globicatena]|uniref:purine-cytosine permease family protein n=1 Tax=Actinokineospora globicatena TaxID=103729 RepID=UPI0020A3BC76|nr:cytosine permease [Actinokineospora globicatena]MCP2303125.1 cytosine permease [Actinokineospora globicatena]GLW79761.1 cytosine permease [Actinokineospora globicatena]GLW85829.1 cytosine permease [Actinokineospora globicatena]